MSSLNKIKLVLADDHALIREGFKSLLGKNEAFEIVGEAETGIELIEVVAKTTPDVILVDISMPDLNGLEAIEQLKLSDPHLKFIVLSMHDEEEYILKAMKVGVSGYLLKNVNRAKLEGAIRTVHEGGKSFDHLVTEILIESAAKPKEEGQAEITPREKEVLALVANGQSTKQIADQLDISIRTVESHRINMLKKFKVSNTAELIRKTMELNILDR